MPRLATPASEEAVIPPPPHSILTSYRKRLDPPQGAPLFQKALSDTGVEDRNRYALLESARVRRALKDPASPDHGAVLAPLADLSDEELELQIILQGAPALWSEVYLELPDDAAPNPEPTLPANATLEQREEALLAPLEAAQSAEDRRERERADLYARKLEDRRAYVRTLDRAAKEQLAKEGAIGSRTSAAYSWAMKKYTVFLSTYTDPDCTQRLWDPARPQNVPPALIAQLYDEYREVGEVSIAFLTARY